MDLTELLARALSIFAVIVGIAMLVRKKLIHELIDDFFTNRSVAFAVGTLEVLFGIFFIIIHWEWATFLEILVSLIGVLIFLEGLFYILISNETFKKLHRLMRLDRFHYFGTALGFIIVGILIAYISLV